MLLQLPQAVVSACPDPDPEASIYPKPPFPQAASSFPSFLECHGRDEAPLRSPSAAALDALRELEMPRRGEAAARTRRGTALVVVVAAWRGCVGEREALRLCAVM